MFGAVNALFSGLAFAFLIYTIWLQPEELRLQREELKMQREALELQADELKRQADEMGKTVSLQRETLGVEITYIDTLGNKETQLLKIQKDKEAIKPDEMCKVVLDNIQ